MSEPFLSAKQAAQAEGVLWRRGALRFLFGALPILPPRTSVESLRRLYDFCRAHWGKGAPLVALCHRRFGKSSVAFILAAEECLRHPRSRCAIVADSKDHARDLSVQIADPIFGRAPDGVRPTWNETQRAWLFPNGSRIEMFGGEPRQYGRARGSKFRLVILEESREHPYLKTSVETVYRAALSDTEGSQMVFLSTVPEQESTDFEVYYRQALEEGNVFGIKLSENPDYPPTFYRELADAALGGEQGGDFQREYENVWLHSDDVRLIVPEFEPPVRKEIIREVPFQAHWRWHMGLDPGGRDPCGMAWCAYDERADLFYVAREVQVRELITTAQMVKRIREVEAELFRGHPIPHQIERWCDPADATLIHNLWVEQAMMFRASPNEDLWGNMDGVRRSVQERTMAVHPSCQTLIWEMTHCRRKKDGTKIEWTKHGHGDVLMAAYYVHRNLVRKPRPKAKTPVAQPLVEMGLVKPQKVDIVSFLRRPYGGVQEVLPGVRRRRGF